MSEGKHALAVSQPKLAQQGAEKASDTKLLAAGYFRPTQA
jgi:hypothetical protein